MSYKVKNILFTPNPTEKPSVAFNQAQAYYLNYPMGGGDPMPINFELPQNFLYGRTDLEKNIIYPNQDAIKVIPNSNVSALNFVVDAYEEFRGYLKINKFNKLYDDPIIKGQDWKATKGWRGLDSYYSEQMKFLLQTFGDNYLQKTKKNLQIEKFEDFLRIFINDFYLNVVGDIPITRSGLLQSSVTGPHFTGLAIQITELDASDYSEKFNKFVNSKNFKMLSLTAANFGFMLDYHVPFRLVANLNSPFMLSYAKNRITQINSSGNTLIDNENTHSHTYLLDEDLNGTTLETTSITKGVDKIPPHTHEIVNGIVQSTFYKKNNIDQTHDHVLPFLKTDGLTEQDVYNTFYERSINDEIELFKRLMFNFYNTFASVYSTYTKPHWCYGQNNANSYSSLFTQANITTQKFSRNPIAAEVFNEEYNDLFWHKLYFLVRLREVNANTNDFLTRRAIKKVEELYILVDSSAAMMYINDYLKQYY